MENGWQECSGRCGDLSCQCPDVGGGRSQAPEAKPFRIGMIGLDTSHVTEFTKLINDAQKNYGCKVVAGYPGGSADIEASASRVQGFTAEMKDKYGVEIVGTIEELCQKVDGVMLESVDGRPHLEQVRPVLAAKKPVFIDKPVAGSLAPRAGDLPPGQGSRGAVLVQLVPAVHSRHQRSEEPRGSRRYSRLRCLQPVQSRAAPSGPLLVRRPRGGDSVHRHGHRMRVRAARPDGWL